MAVATMADLNSVGIMLDHIARTSGPLLLSQWDHPHHRGFRGVLSPECRISSRALSEHPLAFSGFVGRCPVAATDCFSDSRWLGSSLRCMAIADVHRRLNEGYVGVGRQPSWDSAPRARSSAHGACGRGWLCTRWPQAGSFRAVPRGGRLDPQTASLQPSGALVWCSRPGEAACTR